VLAHITTIDQQGYLDLDNKCRTSVYIYSLVGVKINDISRDTICPVIWRAKKGPRVRFRILVLEGRLSSEYVHCLQCDATIVCTVSCYACFDVAALPDHACASFGVCSFQNVVHSFDWLVFAGHSLLGVVVLRACVRLTCQLHMCVRCVVSDDAVLDPHVSYSLQFVSA
jgi:hypothetical protein